jgi:hypothetical protein
MLESSRLLNGEVLNYIIKYTDNFTFTIQRIVVKFIYNKVLYEDRVLNNLNNV